MEMMLIQGEEKKNKRLSTQRTLTDTNNKRGGGERGYEARAGASRVSLRQTLRPRNTTGKLGQDGASVASGDVRE